MEPVDLSLQRLRQIGDAPLKPCSYISDAFNPIPPHKVGIAHLVLKPRFLLADPVGCGKTPQSLAAFGFLKQRDPELRLLVMAERSAIFQWNKSVSKFLVGVTPTIVGYDLDSGSSVSRFERYNTYERSGADVFILSYHQMARDIDVILRNVHNYVVIYDEVQHLKSSEGTSLYPSAQKLSAKGRYVWGLSATPQMNGRLEELYSIMEVIRPGTFGSIERFRALFMEYEKVQLRGRTISKFKSYKNIPEAMKLVRPFYLKRKASDINKFLPKIVTKDVILRMENDQASIYDSIVMKRFPSGGTLPGRRLSKLASLTYAQLASDGPKTLGLKGDSSKMVELLRILSEEVSDEKIIIYAKFRRTIDYICSVFDASNINYVRITGAEKTKQRDDAKEIFNDPSSGVNIICINKAGGSSLDLPAASIEIFYDLPWGWGEWEQVLGRARRIGSIHEKVLAVLLINQGTIDQYALKILRRKEALVEQGIGIDEPTLEMSESTIAELYNEVRKAA